MDTEGALDSIRNNGVSVLSRLIQRKHKGFLSPGTKQTVRNDEERYMYSLIPWKEFFLNKWSQIWVQRNICI